MTAVSVPRAGVPRADIAAMLLDRVGDSHPGLRTRDRDWTWDQVVDESAARGALARKLRADGPFHIGVLLDNVPDFVFWLGGAALAGATIVGINPTRGRRKWPPRSGTPTVS
ncbi:putative fatty-acid--CoA ligase domain protein [Mycobacteroides abscessus subsp. bolletii 1513]|uniref:Putative fatty-acid--CoA ligase domain protein n=1 Tax=Mycobacteroides abscessus subsp. bolletii 1513 TaxID=1299321 RepID=X8DG10_9MYCO|nr:putative fatty-acid--CoA ligase domain protein [Mycobacteroides abscessus subsp. bolletii 1513]